LKYIEGNHDKSSDFDPLLANAFILVIPILFVNDSNPFQGFTRTNSTTPIFVLQKTSVSFPFIKIYPTPIFVGKNLPIPILIGKNPVHPPLF
jgi:hypothetical protein